MEPPAKTHAMLRTRSYTSLRPKDSQPTRRNAWGRGGNLIVCEARQMSSGTKRGGCWGQIKPNASHNCFFYSQTIRNGRRDPPDACLGRATDRHTRHQRQAEATHNQTIARGSGSHPSYAQNTKNKNKKNALARIYAVSRERRSPRHSHKAQSNSHSRP